MTHARARFGLRRVSRPDGFTLIDLLIGVAIVAILATVAVPALQPVVTRYRLNGAARQVMGDLMSARMQAVSQGRAVMVVFPEGTAYQVCDDANADGTVDIGEGAATTRALATQYPGVSVSATSDPVFSTKGIAAGQSLITLINTQGTRTLTVYRTGHVKIN